MKKNINWLLKELDLWVQEGLINDTQAGAIRGRYPTDDGNHYNPRWLRYLGQ